MILVQPEICSDVWGDQTLVKNLKWNLSLIELNPLIEQFMEEWTELNMEWMNEEWIKNLF